MNQDKKTSSFLKAINKYAREQSNAILLEVEEFKKQEIEKATQEGISDAYKLIQKEVAQKKANIISDFAKREQESRKTLFIKRNEIVESVFADAKAKLIDYTTTDNYAENIRKSAREIASVFENKACIVYVKEADLSLENIIREEISNCTIEVSKDITIGSIKAYCSELSALVDETFDTKLSLERESFIEKCNLKVV